MIQIFPGKTAVCVSYPYSKEHSCKKSEKSCARFSRKIGNVPTNQLTIPGLTSTDVENCNVGRCPRAQRQTCQNLLKLLNSLNKVTWFNTATLWNVGNVFYYHQAIKSRSHRLNSRYWPKDPLFGTLNRSKTYFSDL